MNGTSDEAVMISFQGEEDNPYVIVYNARVLPRALFSQILRYGLATSSDKKTSLSGRLKGSTRAFTEMIRSYGVHIDVVSARTE